MAIANLDPKGRLALPAALKRALVASDTSQLVLTYCKGCVWGMTIPEFRERVEVPLSKRDMFADEVMDFVHAMLAPAQDVDVDRQGRVRIPVHLRELAGLDREVVVSSVLDRIEVWDKTAWDARFQASLHRTAGRSGMPRPEE
jgi:MraZ protein